MSECLVIMFEFQIATIVGGLSLQKQRRILNRCPDVIVATPGRLWELVQEVCVACSDQLVLPELGL